MIDNGQQQAAMPEANVPEAQPEGMLPVSRVNELVGHARLDGKRVGRQEALKELQANQAGQQSAPAQQSMPSQGGMSQMSPDQINDMIEKRLAHEREMINRQHHENHAQQVMNDFGNKLKEGSAKYPNFQEAINSIWPPDQKNNLPELILMLNQTPNAADVLMDLYNNPAKIGTLKSNWDAAPHLGHMAMQALSKSVMSNQAADKNYSSAKEPLSQLKSSAIGTDSGPLSVRDLRKLPTFKG